MARKGFVAFSCWRLFFVGVVSVFVVLPNCASLVDGGDTLPSGASLGANQTIVSANGTFELGFFSPNGCNNWYARISVPEKTIVWVANRETPMKNMPGALILATDGRLKLFDSEGHSFWSSDNDVKASRASLKDSGNFVMLGDNNNSATVRESFEHPGNTWLPGMKMWKRMTIFVRYGSLARRDSVFAPL